MDNPRPEGRHLPPGANGAHFTYCRLCEAQCGLVAQVREEVASSRSSPNVHT